MADRYDNARRVYDTLVQLGVPPNTAVGAVGGLMGESGPGLDPTSRNPGDGSDGSDSINFGQWNGPRAANLIALAQKQGASPLSFDVGLSHMVNELNGPYKHVLDALRQKDDANYGANVWTRMYEQPKYPDRDVPRRIQLASDFATALNSAPRQQTALDAINAGLGVKTDLAGAGIQPLAYTAPEAPQPQQKASAMPKAQAAPSDDDFLSEWGVPAKGASATAPAAKPAQAQSAGASDDDFLKEWGVPAKGAAKPGGQTAPMNYGAQGPGDQQGIALGAGLANGIPIAGPYLLGGLERAAAGINSLANNTRFSDELDAVKNRVAGANAAHPYASTGGNVTGAVVGTIPLGATALGARALGMTGPTLLGRMAVGAAGNAALGGADAAARDENPLVGASFGGAGGALGPVVGRVLGAGANKLLNAVNYMLPTSVPGMSRSSANILGHVVAADDPAAIRAALAQHGPDAMLADAGPSTTGLTSALALKPSDAKTVVTNALTQRANGAADRISSQLDASLGPTRDPAMAAREIEATRSAVNNGYSAVHAKAPPVDASAVADYIDRSLETATGSTKKALEFVRKELVQTPASVDAQGNAVPEVLVSNSQKLHNIRKDIDLALSGSAPALSVQPGAIATKDGYISGLRGALDDALKTQVPGMAELDAKSAMLADRQNAVDRGYNKILGAAGPAPATFAAERAAQPAGQNIAENIGIRGRIDRMFGTGTQRDAVTLNKLLAGGEDGYAAANLKTAFGDEPVNDLLSTLHREQTFANTTNEVLQNSATARRTAAGELLKETQPGNMNLMNASLGGMAAQAGKSLMLDPLIKMIMESPNASRNLEIAKALTAQGATRDEILNQIVRLNARNGAFSSLGTGARDAVAGGTNRLLLGATPAYAATNQRQP